MPAENGRDGQHEIGLKGVFKLPLVYPNSLYFLFFLFRGGHFQLLFPAAFFLRADALHAPAFGYFAHGDCPAALGARLRERFAVDGVFAFGIGIAAVKGGAETGFSFHQMPFAALRAGYACVFGFFQRFNVFAFGVVGAADEFFAYAAVFGSGFVP